MNEIKFLKELKYYDEKNGFYTIYLATGSSKYFNQKCKYILDLSNSNNNLEYICKEFSKKFHFSTDETLEFVYVFLKDLKDLKFIDFDESFFRPCKSDFEGVHIVGEREYCEVGNFIRENLKCYKTLHANSYNKKNYNDIVLRSKGFNNKENYFIEYNKNGEIDNLIGVQCLADYNVPTIINLVQYNGKLLSLIEFYFKVENILKKYKKSKIRIITISKPLSNDLLNFFEASGFSHEAFLKKENGINDFDFYSKILED